MTFPDHVARKRAKLREDARAYHRDAARLRYLAQTVDTDPRKRAERRSAARIRDHWASLAMWKRWSAAADSLAPWRAHGYGGAK